MMDDLSEYLPVLIYILLCILIILLIVICVKVIKTMNKVNDIVDEVDEKVKSLKGVFSIVDVVTDKLSVLTEVISDSVVLFFKRIFRKKNKKNIESEDNYEEE